MGAAVAVAPVLYYLIVLFTERAPTELSANSQYGLLGLVSGLVTEIGFWLVLSFVFGALLPYVRGRQAVWKGLTLGVVFSISVGLSTLLVDEAGSAWTFRALQVVLFLVLLGFLLDRRTLEGHGFQRRELVDVYRLREVRFAVGYASPLILLLIGVGQQLLSGDTAEAIRSIIEVAPNALPR